LPSFEAPDRDVALLDSTFHCIGEFRYTRCWSVEELWPGSHFNGERLAAVRRWIFVLLFVFIPVIVRVNLLGISGLLALVPSVSTWSALDWSTASTLPPLLFISIWLSLLALILLLLLWYTVSSLKLILILWHYC
jgi:hypothetical protein